MMEKALKERIVGAIVLVAVVVLVVPVFLDGPPAEGEIISERVPLPGQSEQKIQTIVLDRDRDQPVPARELNAARQKAEQVQVTAPTPQPIQKPPQAETVATPVPEPENAVVVPAAASTTGMWAVQLGSFANRKNAETLAADLRKDGFVAFLSQISTSSGQLHRVRIGPQKDREAADAMAARLLKAGHKGKVLPHP